MVDPRKSILYQNFVPTNTTGTAPSIVTDQKDGFEEISELRFHMHMISHFTNIHMLFTSTFYGKLKFGEPR